MTPAPDVADLQVYTAALADGRLLLRRCAQCGQHHHYPRSYCPFCSSGETDWTQAVGEGEVYSFTVWRRRDDVSVPAFVTLDEGPSILALIDESVPDQVRIGARVRLAPMRAGQSLPTFSLSTPARSAE
ncbi:MAG TPA: zinc ribbon domain-containing protein [Phenylobacterium sp.]|uniref:Zn-ribbon domain-containing OB-fold protein n=1 Tax=Phenylobacterium sp. TaxID=1871053 RepID=UPI002B4685ED|nr:zinc ribbon domain-containing protein [Phenylobacterium sp.]HKR89600.1 zinc ribbon domain-containing protein [Phenylobacterium sp.]